VKADFYFIGEVLPHDVCNSFEVSTDSMPVIVLSKVFTCIEVYRNDNSVLFSGAKSV
jgi:hypothetical protein